MGWLSEQVAKWRFRRSPLGQALRQHVQDFFYSGETLSWMKQANKDELIAEFNRRAAAIGNDPQPIQRAREAVVEYTLFMSPLVVVALTDADKADHPMYGDQPGISGEIYHHIREAADHVDEVGRFLFDHPDATDDDLRHFANTRSAIGLFFANGLNMVRIEIGDKAEWYRPLLEATMVGDEDRLRGKLGLPSVLSSDIDGLAYFNFFEYVLAGHADPFCEWKKRWPQLRLYGR